MTRQEKAERKEQARKALLDLLPDGATVYTVLRTVSRSGMSRSIDLYALIQPKPRMLTMELGDTEPVYVNDPAFMAYLTGYVADLLDYRIDKRPGMTRPLIVGGCGMDMGYHVVDTLARELGLSLTQRWL